MTGTRTSTSTSTNGDIVFTRYLYIKDEVRAALFVSLLNASDDAVFWAYELYFSGFAAELHSLIWKIYFDIYATQNGEFRVQLKAKLDRMHDEPTLIAAIIQELLSRPFSTDVLLTRLICQYYELDSMESLSIQHLIDGRHFLELGTRILNVREMRQLQAMYNECMDALTVSATARKTRMASFNKSAKIATAANIEPNIALLCEVLNLLGLKLLKHATAKFQTSDDVDINMYEHQSKYVTSWNDLEKDAAKSIDAHKMLGLFGFRRNALTRTQLFDRYNHAWVYYASFSPVWAERLERFNGTIDSIGKCVEFASDAYEERFHNRFGYEPDEQKMETKLRALMNIESCEWAKMGAVFGKKNVLSIPSEYLCELDGEDIIF